MFYNIYYFQTWSLNYLIISSQGFEGFRNFILTLKFEWLNYPWLEYNGIVEI